MLRHILLIASGALFIFLTAQIYIVRTPVPLTGQTFGVLIVGGALGARRGFAAVALYVLLGLVGLPFFAEGKGGSAVILGATGGYLIGFIVAGAVVGRLAELGWDRHIGGAIGMMLIGSVLIYAIGLPWLAVVLHLSPADTIAAGLTPFIAWDAGQAGRGGGHLPDRVVADRPASGRPLSAGFRRSARPAAGPAARHPSRRGSC